MRLLRLFIRSRRYCIGGAEARPVSGVEEPKGGERQRKPGESEGKRRKKKEGKKKAVRLRAQGIGEMSPVSAGDQSGCQGPPDGIEMGVHVPTLSIGGRTLGPHAD